MNEEEKIKMKECLEKFLELPLGPSEELITGLYGGTFNPTLNGLCFYLQKHAGTDASMLCLTKFNELYPHYNYYLPERGHVTPERKQLAQALLDNLCTPTR